MSSKTGITFAAKLAAFMLNAQKTKVKCYKTAGFQRSSDFIKGIIPLLHMNVTKSDFKKVMMGATDNVAANMTSVCKQKGLEKFLSFENFSCKTQCGFSAKILIDRFIDTVEFAYSDRKMGQQRVHELASYMQWQHENGIIPKESVKWCKNIKPINGLTPA